MIVFGASVNLREISGGPRVTGGAQKYRCARGGTDLNLKVTANHEQHSGIAISTHTIPEAPQITTYTPPGP